MSGTGAQYRLQVWLGNPAAEASYRFISPGVYQTLEEAKERADEAAAQKPSTTVEVFKTRNSTTWGDTVHSVKY